MKFAIVTPWHKPDQIAKFLNAWRVLHQPNWLILQQDKTGDGCAKTKNAGIIRALNIGAEIVIILDDDCFPAADETLEEFAAAHIKALEPQPVELYEAITDPPSRGTPYFNRTMVLPVAASMGFWIGCPDYDAPGQLAHHNRAMTFNRKPMFWRFFPLSGMNMAFKSEWATECRFVDVPRFDDIWMGYNLQRVAYTAGFCLNLNGPLVRHSRQSDVWQNLKIESEHLEENETRWMPEIAR